MAHLSIRVLIDWMGERNTDKGKPGAKLLPSVESMALMAQYTGNVGLSSMAESNFF
jgi:hypothetical protein